MKMGKQLNQIPEAKKFFFLLHPAVTAVDFQSVWNHISKGFTFMNGGRVEEEKIVPYRGQKNLNSKNRRNELDYAPAQLISKH